MDFKSVSKNCKKEWYILRTIFVLIFAALTVFVALYDFEDQFALKILCLIPLIMLDIFLVIYAYIFPSMQYNRYKFKISDDRIETKFGVVFLHHQIVPFVRMQHIVVFRGILDRMFGMSSVIIFTAGSSIALRNLDINQAVEVTETLKAILQQKESVKEALDDR